MTSSGDRQTRTQAGSAARPDAAPALRRDALRNRQLLLDAAWVLMGERGLDVSYEEIAHAAGTGVGTMYRRFPERDNLLDALFADHVMQVVELATTAEQSDDAWAGITGFLEAQLSMEARHQGLGQLLRGRHRPTAVVAQAHAAMTPVISALVDRAIAAGQLPSGVSTADVAAVHLMVGSVLDASPMTTPADAPETGIPPWRRALAVTLTGLQHADLPGPRPDDSTVDDMYRSEPSQHQEAPREKS